MKKIGFDNDKYLEMQSKQITGRIGQFGNKLYLEFGGKLFDDYHASRVLPGFRYDSKVRLLDKLADKVEIIVAVNAGDIEDKKRRGDSSITYDSEALRLIDSFRARGLFVGSVVITKYSGQTAANNFADYLKSRDIKVYFHRYIQDYPMNIPHILSDEGFGANDYVETERPLAVVTAPAAASGKMAVCLSQLYHEHKRGNDAGYAKFETFPIWNLPLAHPVNLAYEAATVDINDVNMIDPFHLAAYGISTVNYNRDVEVFPILNNMFKMISGSSPYKSPTDMGVNVAGYCITDDEICSEAANQEIIRRYYNLACDIQKGRARKSDLAKIELLMNNAGISPKDRRVAAAASEFAELRDTIGVAIELQNGKIITGRTSELLGAASAALLNALKYEAEIKDEVHLISPAVIEPISKIKTGFLGNENPRLHTDEVLIALAVCTVTNPTVQLVLEQLPKLRGCEAHSTVILSHADLNLFRQLGVNITCDPKHSGDNLYHKKQPF